MPHRKAKSGSDLPFRQVRTDEAQEELLTSSGAYFGAALVVLAAALEVSLPMHSVAHSFLATFSLDCL